MKRVLISIPIIIAVVLIVMIVYKEVNTKYVEQPVEAVIINKEYVPPTPYTTLMSTGKTTIPVLQYTYPEYNIYVEYNNLHAKINSQELYNCLKVGESIKMIYVRKYNKKTNEIFSEYIKHP